MIKTWTVFSVVLVLVAGASFAVAAIAAEETQGGGATVSGNAERGRELYQSRTAYKCYACHGFDGETGSPQLVPMVYDQASFISLVQRGVRGMPAYADVSAQDLADIYAFLSAVEPDAAGAESIPLLNDLLEQIEQAR